MAEPATHQTTSASAVEIQAVTARSMIASFVIILVSASIALVLLLSPLLLWNDVFVIYNV